MGIIDEIKEKEQLKKIDMAVSKIVKGMTKEEINHAVDRELEKLLSHEHLKVKIVNDTVDRMVEETKKILSPITIDRGIMSYFILNEENAKKAFLLALKKVALPYILKKWVKNGGI